MITIPRWAWIIAAALSAVVVIGGTVWWLRARAIRSLQEVESLSTPPPQQNAPSSTSPLDTQSSPPDSESLPPFFAPPIVRPNLPGILIEDPFQSYQPTSTVTPLAEPAPSRLEPMMDDPDQDDLTDDQERQAGTDPQRTDTDEDELKDGDEVKKFRTDPLKQDTDGDGYTDAQEIKNGYNPLGTGRCLTSDCSF